MSVEDATDGRIMPAPPTGYTWVLELNADYKGGGSLWTYKNHPFTWLTGNPGGWSGELEFLRVPGGTPWNNLNTLTASVDEIVEATINAAEHILKELGEVPAARAAQQARANEISARLNGVKVRIK